MVFCKIVKKVSYSPYSQRRQVLHAVASKCFSDMTLLNELPLSETPPGALFVKAHILVIAVEAFTVYLSWSTLLQSSVHSCYTFKFQLCGYFWKVSTQICVLGHNGWWFIALWAPSQAEEREPGSQGTGGMIQMVLAGSWPWAWDTAVPDRCEYSCQGFEAHHQHCRSTLWVTRTLHFYLIKIKGSLSYVQAVLKISQYGNKVMEAIPEATGIQCEVMCIKAAALPKRMCPSPVPGVVNHYLQVLAVEYKTAWKIS